MTSLRERFDDAVASPSPPSLLSGEEVYSKAWHRRRVRNRLASAVVGGCTVAVVTAVAVLAAGGREDHNIPMPEASAGATASPSARPAASPSDRPYFSDGVVDEALAADPDHLYAIQFRCVSQDSASCVGVLYGSDDGGRAWTERTRGNPYQLNILAPGVLGAAFRKGDGATWRFSADGGRTWKDVRLASGTVAAIPPGGWATCRDGNRGVQECAVYAVNAQTGAEKKLASQPPAIVPTGVNKVPAGAGLWVSGYVAQANRTGVSVSHDDGRTWLTHVLGQGEADYPQDINNQSVGIATVDGTTAYAVVSVVTNNGQNRLLVYRTGDKGQTWQRADPGRTLPWVQHGEESFLAADGTHVVQTVVNNPAEWYAGTTGAYTKPAPVTGLEGVDDMRQRVRNAAPGAYSVFDRSAVYTSPDGLRWTRHPVKPS